MRVYSAEDAWKAAEQRAKAFAKRGGLAATYTTHPDGGQRAAWVVK